MALTVSPVDLGLSSAEASRRLEQDGPNVLPVHHGPSLARQAVRQVTHTFALMLWAAALLSLVARMPQLTVAIVVVVLVNGAFAVAQEYRADRAAAQLLRLVPTSARVRRDGGTISVPAAEVVRGDALRLQAGDRVPADARVVSGDELAVDESLVTGESVPVRPVEGGRLLAGTVVVEGEADARVEATGARTRLASIADLATRTSRRPSPLQRQLQRVVSVVSVLAVGAGAVLFVVSLLLGVPAAAAFLLAIGVTVALVPEGLMPTVALALALGAQTMSTRHALVRRLDAVESLGATTVICTDKTGTITRNQMSVVAAWVPGRGTVHVRGEGYDAGLVLADPAPGVRRLAEAAAVCVRGRVERAPDGRWVPVGDPMEVALDVIARRAGVSRPEGDDPTVLRRMAYTAGRRRSSVVRSGAGGDGPEVVVLGAPEAVVPESLDPAGSAGAMSALQELATAGLRVLAVAARPAPPDWATASPDVLEHGTRLLGLLALEDPPRHDVAEAIDRCRGAGIRLVMLTGDHPSTAAAVAREVGLLGPEGCVLGGAELPADDGELAARLLGDDGAVVSRVSPEDKLRIAEALMARGEVVVMTGDGVNDAPALRAADVGVAMGASGSDAARQAADVVLLDDAFPSIVAAVELGRATTANIRRFLTYHLTDNVAEVAPFVVWALTGGQFPLALGVLQVLALDLGTDMLPALALGAEPAGRRAMQGPARWRTLVDRRVLARALGVLGPTEAVGSLATFAAVLLLGGWAWGEVPPAALLATASGSAFTAVAVGQLVNALACRSTTRPVWVTGLRGNPLLLRALLVQAAVCVLAVAVPGVSHVLGGTLPGVAGWVGAVATGAAVAVVDGVHKRIVRVDGRGAGSRPARGQGLG